MYNSNSERVLLSSLNTSYRGKYLSILGDSISTYEGMIPAGNDNYYPAAYVRNVNQTWWMKVINTLGMRLCVNNSWSGSRVSGTNTPSAGCLTRCQNLHGDTQPDVIIVYMGINDFNNEVELGTWDGSGSFPAVTNTFREAYATMIDRITTAYPQAEVWCCTLPPCERNGSTEPPEKNDSGIRLDQFNQAIREIARQLCCPVMEFALCGLTYRNLSYYMGDYASATGRGLHPNPAGHTLLARQAIRQMTGLMDAVIEVGGA